MQLEHGRMRRPTRVYSIDLLSVCVVPHVPTSNTRKSDFFFLAGRCWRLSPLLVGSHVDFSHGAPGLVGQR